MKVIPYNRAASELCRSTHGSYLLDYLDHHEAKTVVVEEEYVDRDFLIDYAYFYSRSFKPINRFTTRYHFFDFPFTEADFNGYLEAGDQDTIDMLNKGYIGFVVIKPIQKSIKGKRDLDLVGRTILRPYEEWEGKDRRVFVKYKHKVSLFGITLELDSLPFQTQDAAVGACATAALWVSMFPLKELFGIRPQSPVEITEKSNAFPSTYRNFPSEGLTVMQILDFMKKVGLDAESIKIMSDFRDIEDQPQCKVELSEVSNIIRSYINCGLPIIAQLRMEKKSSAEPAYHAAVISGYRQNEYNEITELYVHDDGIGPYHHVKPLEGFFKWENDWIKGEDSKYSAVYVQQFMIPIYTKMRLTFVKMLAQYKEGMPTIRKQGLEPELFLTLLNPYKKYLLGKKFTKKTKILTDKFPRFLWVIRSIDRNRFIPDQGSLIISDELYDATSVNVKEPLETIRYEFHLTVPGANKR